MAARTRPGERFSKSVRISAADAAQFARAAGDDNPLHHDPQHAARTRFGRVIASGPQTSALLMACTASHFAQTGPMLGLDFGFRFKKAVFVDQTVRLDWLVVSVRPSASLGGEIVDLRGRMVDESGTTVVGAKGRVLLCEEL